MTSTEIKTNLEQACNYVDVYFPANEYDEEFLDYFVAILTAKDLEIDSNFIIDFAHTVNRLCYDGLTNVDLYYNIIKRTIDFDSVEDSDEIEKELIDMFE